MGIFSAKVAIVTGGASGIGRAVAEELGRRGAKLVLADKNAALLSQTADAIAKSGCKVKAQPIDVTDREAVKNLVESTASEFGRLDFLFNNAGIAVFGHAEDFSYEDWRRVIETNLFGVVNGVFAAYPLMIKQGFGHIINTASLAGLVPPGGLISYVASKYGVVGISNALRVEGKRHGVKVSVVCPGLIDTPMKNSKAVKIDREKMLAAAPSLLPPDQCARVILRGVEQNKAFIVVTFLAKIMWLLHRLKPELVMWLWQRQMNKFNEIRIPDLGSNLYS